MSFADLFQELGSLDPSEQALDALFGPPGHGMAQGIPIPNMVKPSERSPSTMLPGAPYIKSLDPDHQADIQFPYADFTNLINSVAKQQHVDPVQAMRAVRQESMFNPMAYNPSSMAKGLLQMDPVTQLQTGTKDPYDPWENLTRALQYQHKKNQRFGTDELAWAAFNAGPNAIHNGMIPQNQETQNYLDLVLGN